MAAPIFIKIAFYWRNKKAAEANSVDVEFVCGREKLVGQDGILAYSRGLATMKVTVSTVVPTSGSFDTNDIEKILAQEDIAVSFIMGGKFFKQDMAVMSASYKSDSEKGVITGQIVMEGAKPKVS